MIFRDTGQGNRGKIFRGQFKPFKEVFKRVYSTLTMPGGMWTEMGSMDDWKEKAAEYYRDGLSYTDIEALLEVSRKSVSSYIKNLPEYEQVQAERKRVSAAKRRAYKTGKQRQYRQQKSPGAGAVTGETLKREHELAVLELSRERYHG